MDLDTRFPAISDLRARSERRLPRFVWDYFDSATGNEYAHFSNFEALDRVALQTGVLTGDPAPNLETEFLGRSYSMPVGVAPVGMSGLAWPGAENMLARTAREARLPYCLSTVAAATPEDVAGDIGDMGWFQLYAPRDPEIRRDLLARADRAGFHTLVLTVDLNAASRRERQIRAQLKQPMQITPRLVLEAALRPAWSLALLRAGVPRLKTLAPYTDVNTVRHGTAHAGYRLRAAPDWDYLAALRNEWTGKLVVKGVLSPEPAERMIAAGVDAIWVSNHGGRQFEAARPALAALPEMREAVGPDYPLIYDGGIRSGTDVLRAIALGADFVMLGRAWHWGVAALKEAGAAHVAHILRASLVADLAQMGIDRPLEARGRAV